VVGGQTHTPAVLPPRGKTRYSLYSRLGRRQGLSGRMRKILPSPRFDPRAFQPVTSRYTDCASACVGIQLFAVLLCMAGAGHKFDLTFAIKVKRNLTICDQWKESRAVKGIRVLDRIITFSPPTNLASVVGLYICYEGQLCTLE